MGNATKNRPGPSAASDVGDAKCSPNASFARGFLVLAAADPLVWLLALVTFGSVAGALGHSLLALAAEPAVYHVLAS